eukprot:CAMPEP_0198150800 /NCGR_PEP_ID=MMETSP1443-20131203/52493_1 /TAXON_ID=186043 /ORGANISM="Entomoneis sp., Strain CCMP2396" /LENGTH=557 /DNA_ID=CAMNT_0043816223 /DNA_START=96 /DNA_END=1769 /DNA_ORIENTATION=+
MPLTVRKARHLFSEGLLSSKQLCLYCKNLLVAGEDVWGLNAFANRIPTEQILALAEEADERIRNGRALSPLDGIPVSIKANMAVDSETLTAGSRILGEGMQQHTPPVGYDADVVKSLKEAGAIIIGITTMDEFGMGSLGNNCSGRDPTKNPLPYLQEMRIVSSNHNDESLIKIAEALKRSSEQIHEMHETVLNQLSKDEMDDYSPGGSSCGSAVSVSHGSSLVSLGSDTGGSVRLPAAWSGVTGLKPTYGLLSRHGLVSYASSLDTVGILARSSDCIASTLNELIKRTDRTRDSNQEREHGFSSSLLGDQNDQKIGLSGVTIGIPEAFCVKECDDIIRLAWTEAAESLESKGANIRIVTSQELSPEVLQVSLAAYYVLVSAEASSNLARYDGFRYGISVDQTEALNKWEETNGSFSLLEHQFAEARSLGFGPEVIRRILCGTAVLSSDRFHTYYESAAKLRALLTKQLHSSLEQCDALLMPTSVSLPPKFSQSMEPMQVYANDVMTVPASLAGLPAVSVPVRGNNNDTPFRPAVQLIGARMTESKLLEIAAFLETPQ